MHHRRTTKLMASLALTIASIGVIAPHASAAPTVCDPGVVRYSITSSSKDILMTHGYRYATLDSGGYAERTSTSTTSYTAGVTASSSATVQAGVIFAKAEVSVGFSLKAEGTKTSEESFTTGINNNTTKPHTYVWFKGTKRGSGGWKSEKCNSRGETWLALDSGTWKSWNAQYDGVLRCDTDSAIASQFGSFSVQYKAVKTC